MKIFNQEHDPKCCCPDCHIVARKARQIQKIIMFCILIAIFILIGCSLAHSYTDQEAIRAIVGEAANQGEDGMTAVGEVIRKRGSLKGIYGFKSTMPDREPPCVWNVAKKAWYASKNTNLTKGATHFENVKAFGMPSWAKNYKVTAVIGDHTFFRKDRI